MYHFRMIENFRIFLRNVNNICQGSLLGILQIIWKWTKRTCLKFMDNSISTSMNGYNNGVLTYRHPIFFFKRYKGHKNNRVRLPGWSNAVHSWQICLRQLEHSLICEPFQTWNYWRVIWLKAGLHIGFWSHKPWTAQFKLLQWL